MKAALERNQKSKNDIVMDGGSSPRADSGGGEGSDELVALGDEEVVAEQDGEANEEAEGLDAPSDPFLCGECGPDGHGDERAANVKIAVSPKQPTDAEREEHRVTHCPYRSWCRECVEGRGLGTHRGQHVDRCHSVPRVGIDYFFITNKGVQKKKDLELPEGEEGERKLLEARRRGEIIKCIIIRCHESKALFAHVVPCKGLDEDGFVVGLVVSAVTWLGHVKLILKSDNEPALLALVKRSLEAVRFKVEAVESISDEHNVKHDSQGNGGTEVGIRAVRGLFRTIRLCTERRVGHKIPNDHALTGWLLEHTATLITALNVGSDGKTSWSRLRGRDLSQQLYGFGESVMWKQPPRGPQHDLEGNMGPRMRPGTFVGFARHTNAYKVIDDDGKLIQTRGILRRPLGDRWDPAALGRITTSPWSTRDQQAPARVELGEPVERHAAPAPEAPSNPRRFKITMKVLEDHGTSDGCAQCSHIRSFGEAKPGLPHSEACRKRIVESVRGTSEGAARLERRDVEIDRAIAQQMEAALGPSEEGGARDAAHHELHSCEEAMPRDGAPGHLTPAMVPDEGEDL